jgi:hypothetical protein
MAHRYDDDDRMQGFRTDRRDDRGRFRDQGWGESHGRGGYGDMDDGYTRRGAAGAGRDPDDDDRGPWRGTWSEGPGGFGRPSSAEPGFARGAGRFRQDYGQGGQAADGSPQGHGAGELGQPGQAPQRPSAAGAGQAEGDPNYQNWRARQMQAYDEDFRAYTEVRQRTFDSEFEAWRKARQAGASGASGAITGQAGEAVSGNAGPSPRKT